MSESTRWTIIRGAAEGYAERHEDAVRLFKLAFEANPKLGPRYWAACAAVQAEEYALALEWLRFDLKRAAPATVRRWRTGDDLVDVDPKVNDELPDREKWIALWADVQRKAAK